MGTSSWFGKGMADLLKQPQTDMADALSYTMTATSSAPMTATQAQATLAQANGQSLTAGMMQQAYQQLAPGTAVPYTNYPPQQWVTGIGTNALPGVSGTWGTLTPTSNDVTKEAWEAFKKEVMEEMEAKFFDLHNKLDKMAEILQGLVKVEIPTDEIRKALAEEPPF